jgi:hypothetical protein
LRTRWHDDKMGTTAVYPLLGLRDFHHIVIGPSARISRHTA